MTYKEILAHLEKNQDPRGVAYWQKTNPGSPIVFWGWGVTKLKDFAKKIKKNHELALQLWDSNVLDAQLLANFVAEPSKTTIEQIEKVINNATGWVFSDKVCEFVISGTPYRMELIEKWRNHPKELTRRSAYILVAGAAKNIETLPDQFFLEHLDDIRQIQSAPELVKDAMNIALITIGGRNPVLHQRAQEIAKEVGKIEVDFGDNSCQTLDTMKYLNSPALLERMQAWNKVKTM